ncbi:putative membrane protein YeiH [Balneicella halophila]|uniref:Putative membrane protein YeiH n=1 Tax=Balneicella halophila TaxID=1537566 RepID=A0A7L4UPQ3_BALHA|nr:trimeric intracellular cation channel family protein [Balneicella halophila]PVX51723.1 putative membrane protein YeiH [Balneicella halophila]
MDSFTFFNNHLDYIVILDHLGTFAFAVSGIRLAYLDRLDWFGAYVVGLVTAIGGGTTRDVLLDTTPFWMEQPSYLIITGLALITVLLFESIIQKMSKTLYIFDAIGLGLFTVVGIEKALVFDFPWWVAILMGMITGAIGGVIRDVLLNETPLIFRKDVYAMACILGGVVFFISDEIGMLHSFSGILAATTVIVVRIIALQYHIEIPIFKPRKEL